MTRYPQFHAQDPQPFLNDMAVNFNGPYLLMRLLMPHFRDQKSGCVLNIASKAGTIMSPFMASYCASKAALINLTGCIQKEADVEALDDIHLYSIHPGGVRSTMVKNSMYHPLHRPGTHADTERRVLRGQYIAASSGSRTLPQRPRCLQRFTTPKRYDIRGLGNRHSQGRTEGALLRCLSESGGGDLASRRDQEGSTSLRPGDDFPWRVNQLLCREAAIREAIRFPRLLNVVGLCS